MRAFLLCATALIGSSSKAAYQGKYRTFTARITNGGASCSVTSEGEADWISGSTCTRTDQGRCTCTINTGIFSATPSCQLTMFYDLVHTRYVASAFFRAMSSTSIQMAYSLFDENAAGLSSATITDDGGVFNVICTGPR